MKTIIFFILILVTIPVKSQSYLLNNQLIEQDKTSFLGCKKEVFDLEQSFSFNLSSNDLAASFDDIKDEKPRTPEYLEQLKDSISNDSLNFKLLFEIGEYYDRIEDKTNSKKYYKAALKHIDVKFFKNDSATFYGNRSLVKLKLGMPAFIQDAEKALFLNPIEETALFSYPVFLLSNNENEKAKSFVINGLNNNAPYPESAILFLMTINGIEHIKDVITTDPSTKNGLRQKHFKELVDWSSVEIYYEKLNDKQVASKIDHLKLFWNLFLKIGLFDKNENGKILFDFSDKEKKQIKKMERWLLNSLKNKTLNEYTVYKCLGLINFCLEDMKHAIAYYQKAIQVFSKHKPKYMFNTDEAYTSLLFICDYFDQKTNFETILLKKIADSKVKSISDYVCLSKFYLLEENIEKAQFYLEAAEKMNPENFDIYRLKSHLSYVTGTEIILEGFYMRKASRLAKTDDDNYRLYLQSAIYDIINNRPNDAFNKLNSIKRNRVDCETCDRLISKYFKIKN
jgi:tetratricopeptide (TPR) repeat protein